MALQYQKSHHNNVGEYQQSGIPYTLQISNAAALDDTAESGSDCVLAKTVNFPYVTKFITVYSSAKFWIAYDATGMVDPAAGSSRAGKNIFLVPADTHMTFEVKVKDMLFYASANPQKIYLHAGLTGIQRSMFPSIGSIDGVGGT
tara:strand:- start:239 stop:673 length:435 start_codon:yes stop_codon:yes gene_type:complete